MNCSQAEWEELPHIPKRVTIPPKKDWREERGSRRKDLRAETRDGRFRFRVFARKNLIFPENFSLGLVFLPGDGTDVILVRCNGPHGRHVNQGHDPADPHYGHHVHRTSYDDAAAGVLVERKAERAREFGSFDEAVLWLAQAYSIEELPVLLDVNPQVDLFPEEPR